MKTKRTLFGDLPVLGTIRDCVLTETGWRGINDEGIAVSVNLADGGEVPTDHVLKVSAGEVVGVLTIKWLGSRRQKAAPPPPPSCQVIKLPSDRRNLGITRAGRVVALAASNRRIAV